ncbi:Cold shock protein CspA [compost metagenome]
MYKGSVKRFNVDKGYGFIGFGSQKDVFFHISAATDHDALYFVPGEEVEFELGEDKNGRVCASYVKLAG